MYVKKKVNKKILISISALFALFLIYLIPNKNKDLNIDKNLEYYNSSVTTSTIYLLDTNNYLGKTQVVTNSTSIEDKAKELLEVLIHGGTGENKIPNGFVSILPSDTNILSVSYEDGLIKVNFSKELLDINKNLEEK